jgi:hypothetical protein
MENSIGFVVLIPYLQRVKGYDPCFIYRRVATKGEVPGYSIFNMYSEFLTI